MISEPHAGMQSLSKQTLGDVISSGLVQHLLYIVLCIRAFYLLSASAIVVVRSIPGLRQRLLPYGARGASSITDGTSQRHEKHSVENKVVFLDSFMDAIAGLKVPHGWFVHFYILSSVSGLFWLWFHSSYAGQGSLSTPPSQSLSINTMTCMLLMSFQSYRRLYECLTYTASSTSKMWVGHYIFGMAFYLSTNIAFWIDGYSNENSSISDKAEHKFGRNQNGFFNLTSCFQNLYLTIFTSYLNILAITAFSAASLLQHRCHAHLASLPKYTLPDQGLFTSLIAPHYTMECIIYAALVVLASNNPSSDSDGRTFDVNWTMLCALVCVVVNLGVTAEGTKEWMLTKFEDRKENIHRRWKMFPLLW